MINEYAIGQNSQSWNIVLNMNFLGRCDSNDRDFKIPRRDGNKKVA